MSHPDSDDRGPPFDYPPDQLLPQGPLDGFPGDRVVVHRPGDDLPDGDLFPADGRLAAQLDLVVERVRHLPRPPPPDPERSRMSAMMTMTAPLPAPIEVDVSAANPITGASS